MGFVSENWSRKSRVTGSVTEMTKEDIPELSSEGDSVLDRYRSLSSGSERPVVHQVASPPMPADCEFSFFDPNDPKCQEILFSPRTTVSELFAVLRQWVPQVQQNSSVIGNEIGTLRFCGTTEFASGQWAGIELDEPEGKNNGGVGGVQYFSCPPKYGIFAPLSKISKDSDDRKTTAKSSTVRSSTPIRLQKIDLSHVTSKINTGASSIKKHTAKKPSANPPAVDKPPATQSGMQTRTPSTGSVHSEETDIQVGDKVLVVGQRTGVVRFHGKTSFAPGMQTRTPSTGSVHSEETDIQVGDKVLVVGQRTGVVRFHGKTSFAPGIALDKPNGKNNGSVGGVQYFSCPFKHGVFAPPSRVQRVHGSMDSLTDISSARRNHSFPGIKRSFSTSLTISPQRELSRESPVNRSRPAFLRRSWSSTSAGSGGLPPAADSAVKLHQGMQVYLTSSNAIATIRYVGPADFAPGMWLGLELQAPKGKNDGSMGNCRYFTCRPNHGVLVRPSRVTYHGINGAKLMDEGRCNKLNVPE
ncbi:UNVERIFIED_CONTAM: hypothetical protein FKN15_040953 [Acipenser sinensis]